MSKSEDVFIREDENGNKYYCRDIDIDNERVYLKKINKRLDKSLLEANKRIRKYKKTIEDFDLEVCKMKEADTYIDMIIENCNEEQIQHIILGLDQHIANKTGKAMTKTVEFTQNFLFGRKDKSDF